MMIDGQHPEDPLIPEQIREGDLTALRVFDRFDLSVTNREPDLGHPNYGRPTHYNIHPSRGSVPMVVHHSRVIRFDGIPPYRIAALKPTTKTLGLAS